MVETRPNLLRLSQIIPSAGEGRKTERFGLPQVLTQSKEGITSDTLKGTEGIDSLGDDYIEGA